MSKFKNRFGMLALLLIVPGLALAVPEQEPNGAPGSAQALEIGDITVDGVATTGVTVEGEVVGGAPADLDFYSFDAKAGDIVTIDLDRGWKTTKPRLDSVIALFGPATAYKKLSDNDDSTAPDPGSVFTTVKTRDSRIDKFVLAADGRYTVGVAALNSASPFWLDGGKVKSEAIGPDPKGTYTLTISGVTPPPRVVIIGIDIKPGSGEFAPINPKSRGKIPIALLGSREFSVDDVETDSLTFGHDGDEASYVKCGTPSDVNGDLWPDMVCHFENQAAKFEPSDETGILRGKLDDGRSIEGHGSLKVVPVKAQE